MQIINIDGVYCYEQNGVVYLKLETVAKGLGFIQIKNDVEYVRWDRIETYLSEMGFPHKWGKEDYIPENIFYRLAMKAKNETAEKFQAKVADEIIPSIRKTGSYSINNKMDSYMIEDPIERAKRWIGEYEEKKELKQKIATDAPKVQYFDALIDSKLLTNFRDAAKELHISQTQFTGWLLSKKYIYRDSKGTLLPYEPYRANGWFQVKDFVNPYNGFSGLRTLITPTGKAAFRLLLDAENIPSTTRPKHGGRCKKKTS